MDTVMKEVQREAKRRKIKFAHPADRQSDQDVEKEPN